MKRVLIALLALMVCANLASANGLGFFGSYWKLEDADDGGFGGGAKLQMSFGDYVALELRGTYFPDLMGTEPKLTAVPVEIGLIVLLPLSETVKPFFGGGPGYYMFDIEDGEVDDNLGWYALAGVQVGLGEHAAFFANGKYTSIEATVKGDDLGEVEDMDKITGFGGDVGLMFTW